MDTALVSKAKDVWERVPRKYVRVSDILAVIERESGGVPIFHTEDKLYHENLAAACRDTGLTESEIITAVTVESGAYRGMVAKFRLEPSYWNWSKELANFSQRDKVVLACSFGLGQKMARWLVAKLPKPEWISFVKNFMGSITLQMLYVAGDLDALLTVTKGDRKLAFAMYNGGPKVTQNSACYKSYGEPVAQHAAELEAQLKGEV